MSKRRTQHLLQELQRELGKLTATSPQPSQLTVEHSPDVVEEARTAMDMEIAVVGLNSDWETARAIEEAIERAKAGRFGVCESCGSPIPGKRLRVMPWARCCVPCQEAWERREALQDQLQTRPKAA